MSHRMVFIDTAPFIYLFEDRNDLGQRIEELLRRWILGGAQIMTSAITVMEIMTKPLKAGNQQLTDYYYAYFTQTKGLSLKSIGPGEAKAAAEFRAKYGIKAPDALQLGTAQIHGADLVLTNDRDWLRVTEMSISVLSEIW